PARSGRRAMAAALSQTGSRAAAGAAIETQAPARGGGKSEKARGCAGGPGALEEAPSRGRGASATRRRAGGFDARALQHLDAHPGEPAARAGEGAAGSGAARPRREDALELVGLADLELVVAAVLRRLVGPPAHEERAMAEALALHVVVFDLADALDAQRLPGKVLAGAPAALRAGHAAGLRGGAGPLAPGMVLDRVPAQR